WRSETQSDRGATCSVLSVTGLHTTVRRSRGTGTVYGRRSLRTWGGGFIGFGQRIGFGIETGRCNDCSNGSGNCSGAAPAPAAQARLNPKARVAMARRHLGG